MSDNGVAQLNDFGMSNIIDVQGFTTKIIRNIRFTAPELMPIEEKASDTKPNKETDIFSLAMLLLQVSHCPRHSLVQTFINFPRIQLFHGPDQNVQSRLPYNHVRLRSGTEYDFRLLRRIHSGERPIRERYQPMHDQHWVLMCHCWHVDPSARPDIAYVVNNL